MGNENLSNLSFGYYLQNFEDVGGGSPAAISASNVSDMIKQFEAGAVGLPTSTDPFEGEGILILFKKNHDLLSVFQPEPKSNTTPSSCEGASGKSESRNDEEEEDGYYYLSEDELDDWAVRPKNTLPSDYTKGMFKFK